MTSRTPATSGAVDGVSATPAMEGAARAASPRPPAHDRYRHEAYFWRGADSFLARTVPFVLDGLELGQPVMVALVPRHLELLRDALGTAASEVRLLDMSELGANPARIIPAWRDFTDEHAGSGRPVRGIGEPIWPGRRGSELAECQLHEALLNAAVPPDTPLWLLCPYDAEGLPDAVLEEARRSHPVVVEDLEPADGTYGGPTHLGTLFAAELSPPDPRVPVRDFRRGQLAAVRAEVEARALALGLGVDRGQDLALAVHEVAVNSVEHGGGSGDLRMWEEPEALVVEVRDTGRIEDPLAGRHLPSWDDVRGRGLWMAHQLCDLVQVRSGDAGTTVRIHTWL
ncbi:anti-sigma factor RsbA family regulatory protein [Oryzobacter telluris]|uniref:anti-sigma factor RsbA family regulatory protein n=1 Tax=Oryzobacter telluris TaxID=3149179 RepID=UPI00370D3CDB